MQPEFSTGAVTGPLTCPREQGKALAQETEKHSRPWWQLRPPPSLGRHSHATHLSFLVGAKGTGTGHSHSHPGNGDTRGRGSPQAGSGACPGQGWTERSGDAPCKAEGRTWVLGRHQLRQVKGPAGIRLREVKGQSSKGATSPAGASSGGRDCTSCLQGHRVGRQTSEVVRVLTKGTQEGVRAQLARVMGA